MDQTYTEATKSATTHQERIQTSHEWCANMRTTKSISTACLPFAPEGDGEKQYFPVSVCCTSDYCFMDGPNTTFRYRCDNNDECFLLKENVVVQALPAPSTSAAECKATHEGKAGFFPFLPEDTRKRVCNEPS